MENRLLPHSRKPGGRRRCFRQHQHVLWSVLVTTPLSMEGASDVSGRQLLCEAAWCHAVAFRTT